MDWNAQDLTVESELELLKDIDGVTVTRVPYISELQGFKFSVTFDGSLLVNGAQPLLEAVLPISCANFLPEDNDFELDVRLSTAGEAGFVPDIFEIQTSCPACGINEKISPFASFSLSIDFTGEMTRDTLITADIVSGSRYITTNSDMRAIVNRGDWIRIGEEILFLQTPQINLLTPRYH